MQLLSDVGKQVRDWQPVQMPSSQYTWSSVDPSIVHVDTANGAVSAKALGSTRVAVTHALLPDHVPESRKMSDIMVVEPASIIMYLASRGQTMQQAQQRPKCASNNTHADST